jgi:hypothetical protein
LRYPDVIYLRAAEGWLELAAPHEASVELERITPEFSSHPDVLTLCWRIFASLQKLDSCLAVATRFTLTAPGDERGWRAMARTLCLQGHVQQAYQVAIAKLGDFPRCWEFFYDAACYACLLNKMGEARKFLNLAMALGDARRVKAQAKSDGDLHGLR